MMDNAQFASGETKTTIQIRRGPEADLPPEAAEGEFLFCLDSHRLFSGMGAGEDVVPIASDADSIGGVPIAPDAPTDGDVLIYDQSQGKWIAADPVVSGPDAPGAVPTKPPVQIGAIGPDGKVTRLVTTAASELSTHDADASTQLANILSKLEDGIGTTGVVAVSNFPATQPVSAAALPLPAGAATEASLGTDGAAPPSIPGTGIRGWLRSIYDKLVAGLGVTVANFPATQPVSGNVAVSNFPATQNVAVTAAIPAGTNLLGKVAASPDTSTLYNGTTALTPVRAALAAASNGAQTLLAATAGKKIRVLAFIVTASAAVNVKFQSGASGAGGDLTGLLYCDSKGGAVAPFNPFGWFETNVGEELDINLSAATAVGGCYQYVLV
jgi:hypothetical protein